MHGAGAPLLRKALARFGKGGVGGGQYITFIIVYASTKPKSKPA